MPVSWRVGMPLPGITREHPNFHQGPSIDSPVIRVLAPGTLLDVFERHGDYFRVRAAGQIGFVHVDYVLPNPGGFIWTPDVPSEPEPSLPRAAAGSLAADPVFAAVGLATGTDRLLSGSSTVARVWNRYGGLIEALSTRLDVDPAMAIATLAVESGGRSSGPDGRMLIRFENHVFHQYWGASHEALFAQHFGYDARRPWLRHCWRPDSGGWQECHGGQAGEWRVFEYACGLDERAAKLSISMGVTQVMGFNYTRAGYASPLQMFEAFSQGPRYQVIAFFDFVRNAGALPALQFGDSRAFARAYNGAGQVEVYAALIREAVDEFRELMLA